MASAKPGVHILTLDEVQVPDQMKGGDRFALWADQVRDE